LKYAGGLSRYLGSFLTQFYYYPLAGTFVITLVVVTIFLLFYAICRKKGGIEKVFFIPFLPVVILSMAFVNIHFRMSYALGILFALAMFWWYIRLKSPLRYYAGWIFFIVVYLIAGGNACLFVLLLTVFELFESKGKYKLYPVLLLICAFPFPYLAWLFLYDIPLREAFFSLTPVDFLFPTPSNFALWISFPLLYLFWLSVANKVDCRKMAVWKTTTISCVLFIIMLVAGIRFTYDKRAEILSEMSYDIQHEKWEEALRLSAIYPTSNKRVCYLTNLALCESGQMPYRMFHYQQIGPAGLFLERQLNYISLWSLGEVYYRLGMIPEAEHCAFEALVSSPNEANAQALQRLALTNLIRRDSSVFCKYVSFFENTLVYGKWAKQQRLYLNMALIDSSFQIPDTPVPYNYENFYIDYANPDYALHTLLQSNPNHKKAFEYLMAYYMLQQNIEAIKKCIDLYYKDSFYPAMPVLYEEALLVYKNINPGNADFLKKYPVSETTLKRFDEYAQVYKNAKRSKRDWEQLNKRFGNTYWFYVHFTEPALLHKEGEKYRY
jgi:hypothetical protein